MLFPGVFGERDPETKQMEFVYTFFRAQAIVNNLYVHNWERPKPSDWGNEHPVIIAAAGNRSQHQPTNVAADVILVFSNLLIGQLASASLMAASNVDWSIPGTAACTSR